VHVSGWLLLSFRSKQRVVLCSFGLQKCKSVSEMKFGTWTNLTCVRVLATNNEGNKSGGKGNDAVGNFIPLSL
jgi:hypothetical protein